MSILVIGLGGFGKWVVTAFKNRLLERYEKPELIPTTFRFIAFDLTTKESPNPEFLRFGFGRCVVDTPDYSSYSPEFHLLSGDYQHEVEKIQQDAPDKDEFISQFMTKKDAGLYLIDILSRGVAAGERRQTSRTVFFLDAGRIREKLERFLTDNCICFVVSSTAGGTGCGSVLDFLLLLQAIARAKAYQKVYRVPVLFLPHGFKKAKEGEDLTFPEANCYAFYREFSRLNRPETRFVVSYNHSAQDVKKEVGLLGDLPVFIDGATIGGRSGADVPYYDGTVQSVVDFIESLWYTEAEESGLPGGAAQLPASYDNIIKHYVPTNLRVASDNPQQALVYSTFGTFKWLLDTPMIKRQFSQQIAADIIKQYVDSPNSNRQEAAQGFLKKATNFASNVVYELVNKGIGQMRGFATESSLEGKLRCEAPHKTVVTPGAGDKEGSATEQVKLPGFPQFLFDTELKLTGNVAAAHKQLIAYEEAKLGSATDACSLADLAAKRSAKTYHAVRNFYKRYYEEEFERALREEVLAILSRGKDTAEYGKGALRNAEAFLVELIECYYQRFLGDEERGVEGEFGKAVGAAKMPDHDAEVRRFVETYAKKKAKALGLLGDWRNDLKAKLKLANQQRRRALLWEAVKSIAKTNLAVAEALLRQVRTWIGTFEAGLEWVEKQALPDVKRVRNAKRNVKCHHYLTNPGDDYEHTMYEVIRGRQALSEEQKDNPVLTKLPVPGWAKLVSCCTWGYNIRPGPEHELPNPKLPEGHIHCGVDLGMPNWPHREEFLKDDRTSILAWNNQLAEYYVRHASLGALDSISVLEVLYWQGVGQGAVTDEILAKTCAMLRYDENRHKGVADTFQRLFPRLLRPRMPKLVLRGFLQSDSGSKGYNKFLAVVTSNLQTKGFAFQAGDRSELLACRGDHLLTAQAITNLTDTRNSYVSVMNGYLCDKSLSPHVLQAEKTAFVYETEIARMLQKPYRELHHETVSALEDVALVNALLFTRTFSLLSQKEYTNKQQENMVTVKLANLKKEFKKDQFSWTALLRRLMFPSADDALSVGAAVDRLKTDVASAKSRCKAAGKYSAVVSAQRQVLDRELKRGHLVAADRDLYLVWMVMLNK
jgi:hypothetical protein